MPSSPFTSTTPITVIMPPSLPDVPAAVAPAAPARRRLSQLLAGLLGAPTVAGARIPAAADATRTVHDAVYRMDDGGAGDDGGWD